jgi:type VI secretion system protein ImpM
VGWTMFGKTPREGDFVRHDLRDPIAMECFRWVADAVAQQPAWVRAVPAQGVRFVFRSATAQERVLVGVMVRSQDRVGREFPLVALHEVSALEVGRAFPAVPLAWCGALGDARRVMTERASLEPIASVASALSGIAPPRASDLRDAYARASRALQLAAAEEFHDRVFGDADAAPHYAYHTVRVAAAQVGRAQGPALVCPVTVASDATAWLELLRRLVPALDRPLGCLWTSGVDARLVVCLSDMPTTALHAVVGCAAESSRIWPLSTSSDAARAKARAVIAPLLPSASAPLVAPIDALAQWSSA